MNDLLWCMGKGEANILVAIDLSAAFHTVDHNILIKMLQYIYGVEKLALPWFDSYLRTRFFNVCVGQDYSNDRELKYSVSQDSAGGTLLFNNHCSSL